MKKYLFLIIATIAFSCAAPTDTESRTWGASETPKTPETVVIPEKRVKVVERGNLSGYNYFIIEVDGKEYIAIHDYDITPLITEE